MRSMAFAAPLFMLAYGVLRWIDGLDGHRKGGPAWNLGHLAFLASMVTFVLVAAALFRRATLARRTAVVAVTSAVSGAACMIWVIIGDLSATFRDRWPLPGALETLGPICFVLGMVALLSLQVAAGRLPVWSPVLLFLGYTAITVSLDLLPLAALLMLGALAPLGRAAVRGSRPARPAGSPSRTA